MRLVRLPRRDIDAHGSSGVAMEFLPPLVGDDARVHVAHLAAGGTIGRHPAAAAQLFAVIAGEGEVSGDDGARLPIVAGQAAVWDTGEVHQSWAVTDMTVVLVETAGSFELGEHFPQVSRGETPATVRAGPPGAGDQCRRRRLSWSP